MAETDGASLGWGPALPVDPGHFRSLQCPVSAVRQEGLPPLPRAPCPGRLSGRQADGDPGHLSPLPYEELEI